MNRMEMLLELKKDNTKRFIGEDGVEYFVREGKLQVASEDYKYRPYAINFEDEQEYTEIILPLWEVVELGQMYYYIDLLNGVEKTEYCGYTGVDEINENNHNMFRTEGEAFDKFNKVLDFLVDLE